MIKTKQHRRQELINKQLKNQNYAHEKKDILKIILTVLISVAVFFGIIWLICKFVPILIGAIVFIPLALSRTIRQSKHLKRY